jgi:class 3 adenylate cyclase
MCRPVEIGSAQKVYHALFSRLVLNIFLASSMFSMGLYHLFLFHFRRQNKAALYFGIACLIGTARILVTNYSLETVTTMIPWTILTKIEYLTLAFGITVFIMFISHVFPGESFRKISLGFLAASTVYGLFVTATPPAVFTRTLAVYQIVIVFGVLYIISIVVRSLKNRREGSLIFLTSTMVMAATIINDILYVKFIVNTGHIGAFGFFVFYFGQSVMLSLMFSRAFNRSESLSQELLDTTRAYSRFVPAQFLEYLDKTSITDINLGDQIQRDMTILFADIRSFTTLSEKMPPQENFNFLNSYLKRMGPVIRRNGGFIDKYIGDGIMALFPGRPDDALAAILEMRQELELYNTHRRASGYRPIRVGYGVHTGKLMLGVIGESERMESTVISDAVNIASRIESLTKEYGCDVLLSDDTFTSLANRSSFNITRIGKVKMKGKRSQMLVHRLND